jgi:AcrR family transcriptional regulator
LARPSSGRREKVAAAAAKATYEQGFRQTTLADIARAANVPIGSVYYYFKSKEDVAEAVIGALSERYDRLQEGWERPGDAKRSILAFVEMIVDKADTLKRYGCPIGSLGTELGKEGNARTRDLGRIFSGTLAWMTTKFSALGCDQATAAAHAHHVLTVLEGATLLSHVFGSRDPIDREGERLRVWIEALGPTAGTSN